MQLARLHDMCAVVLMPPLLANMTDQPAEVCAVAGVQHDAQIAPSASISGTAPQSAAAAPAGQTKGAGAAAFGWPASLPSGAGAEEDGEPFPEIDSGPSDSSISEEED